MTYIIQTLHCNSKTRSLERATPLLPNTLLLTVKQTSSAPTQHASRIPPLSPPFNFTTLRNGPRGPEDNPKTAQEASETVPIPPRTAPRRQEKRPIQKPTFASHAASQRRNIRVRGPERSYFIPARAWLDRAVGLCGLRLRATFGGYVWGLSFRSFRLGATFGGFRLEAFVWGLRCGGFRLRGCASAPSLLSAIVGAT